MENRQGIPTCASRNTASKWVMRAVASYRAIKSDELKVCSNPSAARRILHLGCTANKILNVEPRLGESVRGRRSYYVVMPSNFDVVHEFAVCLEGKILTHDSHCLSI